MEGDGCYKRPITDVQKRFAKQIVFAQRNFRCATVVSITQCVAVHCEALANTVEGYIAARLHYAKY